MSIQPSKLGTLIVVIIILAVAAFLMANGAGSQWPNIAATVSVVLFAVPCLWATKMWLGWRYAALLFVICGAYALLAEVATGFDYGRFSYSGHPGYKLFDAVPWTVAFTWTPLLFAAYSIAANLSASRAVRIVFTTFGLLTFETVVGVGAAHLGFWSHAEMGILYGMPLSTFASRLLSSAIGAALLDVLVWRSRPLLPVPIQLSSSAFSIIFFWTALCAFAGLAAPALIGLVILCVMVVAWHRFHYSFDDKIVLVDEDNNAIGTAYKLDAHNSKTALHRAFSVFIFNEKGELLLQQRALSKKTWPGVWSNSCCGHVMLHETTTNAAARRLKFELGLNSIDLITALPDFRYRAEKEGVVENELCPVLVGLTNDHPVPNPSEVASVRWIDWKEFLGSLDEPGNEISPWAIKEVRLLASSDVFAKWFASRVTVSEGRAVV